MEREQFFEQGRRPLADDGLPAGGNLNQQRSEIDGLLRASDEVFDSINDLHAQTYLEQNLQTGGQ